MQNARKCESAKYKQNVLLVLNPKAVVYLIKSIYNKYGTSSGRSAASAVLSVSGLKLIYPVNTRQLVLKLLVMKN